MEKVYYGYRHPNNPYGQGSPEFYKAEAQLYGFETVKECMEWMKSVAPKCPVCGVPSGFSFGTGDCECEVDRF